MNDETATKKTGTDLKGIDKGRCSKEKNKRLDASHHREKLKDTGSQVLEHEGLDRGWAWLVLLGAFLTAVSHMCINISRLTYPHQKRHNYRL